MKTPTTKLDYGTRKEIELEKLIVWKDNPRIEQATSEREAINSIFKEVGPHKMLELMTDIMERGLQANEITVVVESDNKYLVYDGNRRISALKVYNNPEIIDDENIIASIEDYKRSQPIYENKPILVLITTEEVALELSDRKHGSQSTGQSLIRWSAWQRDESFHRRNKPLLYPKAFEAIQNLDLKNAKELKSKYGIEYTDLERILGFSNLTDFINSFEEDIRIIAVEKIITKIKKIKNRIGKPVSRIIDTSAKIDTFIATFKTELEENNNDLRTLNPSPKLDEPRVSKPITSRATSKKVKSKVKYSDDLIDECYRDLSFDINYQTNQVLREMLAIKKADLKRFPISFCALIRLLIDVSTESFLTLIKHELMKEKRPKFAYRIKATLDSLTKDDFEGLTEGMYKEIRHFISTKLYKQDMNVKTKKIDWFTGDYLDRLHSMVHSGTSAESIYDFKNGLNAFIIPFVVAMSNHLESEKIIAK